ncbi:hypothetical protein H2202_004278 [Exophiala xenobiotica]|nr:hypothetical protein H2202_004278 [Exophiala xenobiotica]KAK5203501.1 hypothetical protein LTR41_010746 [Exophiala xenobiotica]KAK5289720.1 hypothetical protein LTR14_007358 [Exophiala xenobiotica]KAK5491748.1 hypothetical protein LTR55_003099 [Exophiala xenobiotica]
MSHILTRLDIQSAKCYMPFLANLIDHNHKPPAPFEGTFFYISLKIAPPALGSCAFVLDPSPSLSPTSPRPVSPRSHQSHPVPIRDLPNSSSLSQGPGLSPPPPVRFRVLPAYSPQFSLHKRARSAPSSLSTFVPQASASSVRKVSNHTHTRTQSTPQALGQQYAAELRDSDHRDRAVRSPGDSRVRDLCDPEPSQHVRKAGEGGGRRRRMTRTRTLHVRFQLDDDDTKDPVPPEPEETSGERTISGLLRLEDERDSWF